MYRNGTKTVKVEAGKTLTISLKDDAKVICIYQERWHQGFVYNRCRCCLQGKAAAVQIINSGGPGEAADIRIRGYSSNSGNIGPLLIVDGLKVDNIQYLDPSMIESMEVLKDAASAAIYGAQAGNGVVIITTKTGAANGGKAQISYSSKFTIQSLGKGWNLWCSWVYWVS